MDADSSYGGSDTAQDSTLGHDNNSLETTIPNHTESTHDHHDSSSHHDELKSANSPVTPSDDSNTYYKNEITLPVNYDETDKSSLPHYLSTAKLTIEESLENHHNLDELSKNYSSTHNLNAETPKLRKKSTSSGIDNPAYQEDETKTPTTNGALKSTFGAKKSYNNGDLNSSPPLGFTSPTKTDEPLSEAVNLELINLKPAGKDVVGAYENGNGISDIPVKKETEVEIGNPYDEYFVPVNEHRKYMRGEKLYLTKDKRDTKKRNRCLCWSLLLAVVVAAVIVGILAAVGIIGNQEPEPIQEARNFGGSNQNDIKTGGGFFGISDEGDSATKTSSRTGGYPITPEPPLSTSSSLLPTTDTSMIEIPRALESEFKIDSIDFSEELMNPNSTEYKNLAAMIENKLKETLFTNDAMNYGPANIQLKVTEFLPGSVVVKYRIGWEFKDGIHNPQDPITVETLKNKLQNTLSLSNGYIDEYHVQEDTLNAGKIMNVCEIQKNGCEYACAFDYKLVNFICTCPDHQQLAMDGKNCVDKPVPHVDPEPGTDLIDFEFEHFHTSTKPIPEPEATPEPIAHPEPEPTAQPEPEPSAEPTVQPEPVAEPTVQPEPEPAAEPTVQPEPVAEPTVQPEPEPAAEPTVQPEPVAEPTVHPEPEPAAEPTVQPEPIAEPTVHPEPEPAAEPTAQPEPVAEPTAQPEPEPAAEPTAQPEHVAEPTVQPEPTAEPTPEPAPKSETQSAFIGSYTTNKVDHQSMVYSYTTTSESTPSSEREGKLDDSQHDGHMYNIPAAEPTPEPLPITTTEPASVAEPTAEPQPEPAIIEPMAHTEMSPSLIAAQHPVTDSTPQPEPSTEPVPVAEREPSPEPEPTVVPELTTMKHSSESTESNASVENETHDHQEGHMFIVPSAERHTTTLPEITTMNQEVIANNGPKIQDLIYNDSNITTANVIEAESPTTTFKVENVPEKTTMKSDVEQLTNVPIVDIPTTTNPEQSTHEKIISPETTTLNLILPLNDATTQMREIESMTTVMVPMERATMKSEEQTTLMEQPVSENNSSTMEPNTLEQTTQMDEMKQSNWIPVELHSKDELVKIETTTALNSNDGNFIPVVINNDTHLIDMENSTLPPIDTTSGIEPTMPIVINNQVHLINTENSTMPQKEIETISTVQQTTPETINITSSTTQNIIYIQDYSTENVISHQSPETHQHLVTYDPTESPNHLDNMSPFLPEIENDTLVKILHSDVDHFTDMPFHHHNDSDMHEEHIQHIPQKPPRLDNDEMNVTNPQDPNPTDTTVIGVVSSEESKTERLNEILSSSEVITPKEEISGATNSAEMTTMVPKEQPTTNIVMQTISPDSGMNIATTMNSEILTTSPRNVEPTLNPDIVNNVHSNNFFFNLQTSTERANIGTVMPEENTTLKVEESVTSKIQENVTASHENFTDVNTSTEDLVALETTTNKLSEVKDTTNNDFQPPLTITAKHNVTTLFADIVHIASEVVHFKSENNSLNVTVRPDAETTMITLQNDSTEKAEKTPQYEVHENLSEDVTTTRTNILKLYTTESTVKTLIENEEAKLNKSDDPLSVIALPQENLFVKLDKKRAEDNYNKFDPIDSLYDPNDFLNDISDEEKSVLDKFVDVDHLSNKQKEEKLAPKSSDTKLDYEHDHYLATDFTDKATFTATPKKNYFENSDKDSYSKLYFPGKTTSAIENEEEKSKNTTEPIAAEAIKPVTEGFTISGFSRCAAGQFQCRNGTAVKDGSYCIPSNDQCDSTDDCTDASDEVGCAQEKCRDNFQCTSGQCLKRNLVCDGISNCNDRSDEQNCESWKCRFDEFSCGDGGRCIPLSWKCDGLAHCPGAEDEYQCHTETCNSNSYHCVEQGSCIRSSLRCDGKQDCAGGDDENLCECAVDQFKCKLGGGCIPSEQQCDGIEQCPDFSDEWNCLRLQESAENATTANNLEVLSNKTWLQICSDSWNNSYSDLACQSLGYAGATSTEFSKMLENSTNNQFYKLKSSQQYGAHLLTQLEKTDSCDSVVAVTCQEFVCGSHSSLDTQSARIIGGSSAAETQWPSVTLLYNKKHNRQCTATLIAPLWVIASYSCVLDTVSSSSPSQEWILYAGGTNFFSNVDNSTTQIRSVKNVIIHPQEKYSQFVYKHDMVLVELASPLMLGQNVAPICLPNKDIEPRQLCVTAGWGISKPGDSNTQQYLHYLPVPTIDMEECNSTKHYNGRVPDDKICAGYTDSDKTPCYNDEGAPLMCFSDSAGTWELHGLLAYHSNCGRNHHPALYSSINADSRQWIANTIGLKAVTNQRLALNKE